MRLNGYAVREIRRKMNKTVTLAAAEAGVSQPTWSNWERGERNASELSLEQICLVLELEDRRAILMDPAEVPS